MATPQTPTTARTAVLAIPGTELSVVVGIVPTDESGTALEAMLISRAPRSWQPVTRAEAITKYPEGRAWDAPAWSRDDDDKFEWVAATASNRTLLGFLRVAEQGSLTGDQIASLTAYRDAHSFRAALPHLRAYCSRVDRQPIWMVDDRDDVGRCVYTMRPEVRELALRHLAQLG